MPIAPDPIEILLSEKQKLEDEKQKLEEMIKKNEEEINKYINSNIRGYDDWCPYQLLDVLDLSRHCFLGIQIKGRLYDEVLIKVCKYIHFISF